jgi:hypothetical protein
LHDVYGCYELIHCGCKKACCKCVRSNLKCTVLCTSSGNFSRQEKWTVNILFSIFEILNKKRTLRRMKGI